MGGPPGVVPADPAHAHRPEPVRPAVYHQVAQRKTDQLNLCALWLCELTPNNHRDAEDALRKG